MRTHLMKLGVATLCVLPMLHAVTAYSAAPNTTGKAAASAPAAAPASANSAFEGVEANARKEGKVYVYTISPPAVNERLAAAFKARYPGIAVTIEVKSNAQREGQIKAEFEAGAGAGDVFISSNKDFNIAHPQYFTEIRSPRVKEKAWAPYVSENRRTVDHGFSAVGVIWNTNAVPKGIKTFEELPKLDPKISVAMGDPSNPGVGAWLYQLTQRLGDDWLKSLLSRKPRLYDTATGVMQAAAAGEVDVVIPGFFPALKLKRDGAPIDISFPSPRLALIVAVSPLARAPHPNAAQLFIHFLLSREAQEITAADSFSALPDVKSALGDASNLISIDTPKYLAVREEFLAKFKKWRQDCPVKC